MRKRHLIVHPCVHRTSATSVAQGSNLWRACTSTHGINDYNDHDHRQATMITTSSDNDHGDKDDKRMIDWRFDIPSEHPGTQTSKVVHCFHRVCWDVSARQAVLHGNRLFWVLIPFAFRHWLFRAPTLLSCNNPNRDVEIFCSRMKTQSTRDL